MISPRVVFFAGVMILLTQVGVVGKSAKVTNWKVETTIELRDPAIRDSSIASNEPSMSKGTEKVNKLVGQLQEQISKQFPAVFYDNPPWAGVIKVNAVMRQQLSVRSSSIDESFRAKNVSDTLLAKGRLPGTESDADKQKRVNKMKIKAKEFEFVGLQIKVIDMGGQELQSTWHQASASGKCNVKKCASEIAKAMSTVASRPETPVFDDRK